uniref:ADP/ATP translocase n=1 Tax=Strigamia maritima TaxID=126957 RepID=T1J889_STRMM
MPKENHSSAFDLNLFLLDFSAGGIAAGISETIVAPLERVKILLQVQHASSKLKPEKHYKGLIDAFIRIPKEQGIRSLWRGNLTHVIRCWPSFALNFAFKEVYKKILLGDTRNSASFWTQFASNTLSGGFAGATTLAFLYPLDFVETRLAADVGGHHQHREFSGIINCMQTVVKTDGIRGLYRGFTASVQGIFVYRASYFGLYDTFKILFTDPDKIPFLMSWALAQGVTTFSSIIAYPFDTVRRRLMMQSGLDADKHMYKGVRDCWRQIYRIEGVSGYFKGGFTSVFRSVGGALILVLYDQIKMLHQAAQS